MLLFSASEGFVRCSAAQRFLVYYFYFDGI